jgi:hypothetical protein
MDTNQFSSDQPANAAAGKKPYEKPTFRFEKVFVTTALSCGKIGPTEHGCKGFQSAS